MKAVDALCEVLGNSANKNIGLQARIAELEAECERLRTALSSVKEIQADDAPYHEAVLARAYAYGWNACLAARLAAAPSECAGKCTDPHTACSKCKADFKAWLAAAPKVPRV